MPSGAPCHGRLCTDSHPLKNGHSAILVVGGAGYLERKDVIGMAEGGSLGCLNGGVTGASSPPILAILKQWEGEGGGEGLGNFGLDSFLTPELKLRSQPCRFQPPEVSAR